MTQDIGSGFPVVAFRLIRGEIDEIHTTAHWVQVSEPFIVQAIFPSDGPVVWFLKMDDGRLYSHDWQVEFSDEEAKQLARHILRKRSAKET